MTGEIQDSEVITSNPNLANTSNDNAIINLNSDDQSNYISRGQLQDILNTVMQAISAESAKQTAESAKQISKAISAESAKQTAESAKQISKAISAESAKQTATLQEESKKQTALLQEESKKALQEESKKQTALLQEESKKQTALLKTETAKLTSAVEDLRSEIKKENESLAKSLTAKFEAAHDKIREDFEVRLNSEILIVSERIDNVRKDNEHEVIKLSATIDELYASVSEKTDTVVTQTREAVVQIREYVDDKFRAVSGDIQQVRKYADEISKVNATLGELQNKLASGNSNTPQSADSGNAIVRVITTEQQAASVSSVETNTSPSTNGVNVSSNSACHDSTSVVSQTTNSGVCTSVNVTSEMQSKSVDLSELTLPSFTDSSKQVPLHFIRDLDLYFKLKQTPDHLKLPLTFRAVQEPIAKQWFSSTYDKLNSYEEFRKGFTDLLWNPNRQAGIRSQIYLDKHFSNSGESYVDHYIRYANLASSLDPPMTDMDLLSALTSHYEPRVQQGLLCGNFKCTQDVLGYLSKLQGLNENRDSFKAPRRDYTGGDRNRRPQLGSGRDDRPRDRGNNVNVHFVRRQTPRRNSNFSNRRHVNADDREFYGRRQGRAEGNNSGQLNPNARQFNPHIQTTPANSDRNDRSQNNEAQTLNN